MYNALRRGELVELRYLFGNARPKLTGMEKRLHCIIFRLGPGKPAFLFGGPWANGDLSSQ